MRRISCVFIGVRRASCVLLAWRVDTFSKRLRRRREIVKNLAYFPENYQGDGGNLHPGRDLPRSVYSVPQRKTCIQVLEGRFYLWFYTSRGGFFVPERFLSGGV